MLEMETQFEYLKTGRFENNYRRKPTTKISSQLLQESNQ
jgi:hypothetical protein